MIAEHIDDIRKAHAMANAANHAFDEATAYNEAIDILRRAGEAGISASETLAKKVERRAARIVMKRAAEQPAYMRYIDTYYCSPKGLAGTDCRPQSMAPEMRVAAHLEDLIETPPEGMLEHRDRSQAMDQAADMAAVSFDMEQPLYEARFESALKFLSPTASDRIYLDALGLSYD